TLLGDGVRVLTRAMRRITEIAGAAGARLRDRSRSVKLRLLEIARTARSRGQINHAKLRQGYRRLLDATSRVGGQAKPVSGEIAHGVNRAADVVRQAALEGLRQDQHAPGASCSACSSRRPRSFARANPGGPTSSARWSGCRKPRIRSSSTI